MVEILLNSTYGGDIFIGFIFHKNVDTDDDMKKWKINSIMHRKQNSYELFNVS